MYFITCLAIFATVKGRPFNFVHYVNIILTCGAVHLSMCTRVTLSANTTNELMSKSVKDIRDSD